MDGLKPLNSQPQFSLIEPSRGETALNSPRRNVLHFVVTNQHTVQPNESNLRAFLQVRPSSHHEDPLFITEKLKNCQRKFNFLPSILASAESRV